MSTTTVNPDLSSVTISDDGTMECVLPNYNPETLIPFGSEDEVRSYAASIEGREFFWIPKLSDEEKAAIAAATASQANSDRAKQELVSTDWSDLPSVRNTAVEPHLINGADFDTYRAALRAIVVSKPAVVESWPVRPDAVWSEPPTP
jgi:hypothetical protein